MSAFDDKRARRIERMHDRAERLKHEASATIARADQMASVIPFGQPILVGHHSEKRDRNYRDKIHRTFSRGYDTLKEAERLERRATAAENSDAIFSDDPNAVEKLREKAADLEKLRARAKEINRAVRSKQPKAALEALGLTEKQIANALTPDFAGRLGVPSYVLTNTGSEIRRIRERIAQIERVGQADGQAETICDIRIEQSENRVRMFFPDKPAADVRAELKRYGFRWSPMAGAWQRHANAAAWYEAKRLAQKFGGMP